MQQRTITIANGQQYRITAIGQSEGVRNLDIGQEPGAFSPTHELVEVEALSEGAPACTLSELPMGWHQWPEETLAAAIQQAKD